MNGSAAQEVREAAGGLHGRERHIGHVAEMIAQCRLVTLTGTPGIGKTRLALAVAGRHPDFAAVVELAAAGGAASVASAIASALAAQEVPGQAPIDTIVARLSRGRLLLVLDNCEHVLDGCRAAIARLLADCPDVRVLATSREPLGLAQERAWRVPPLATPPVGDAAVDELLAYPAVGLFVRCAREVHDGFALSPFVAGSVAEICRRLDGIPLGIELAAARVETLTPEEIAERLHDHVRVVGARDQDPAARHRTLAAALDWSHALLDARERVLFRRLAAFNGRFGIDAAVAVCAGAEIDPEAVPETLARLAGKSLLVAEPGHAGEQRYRLLETIRAYAGEQLERSGEAPALRTAHAEFYVGLAERAEPELCGAHEKLWLDRLDAVHANLRAALEWALGHGRSELALRLTGSLVLFWRIRCRFSEGRDMLAAALGASTGRGTALENKVLWGAGFMTLMAGDFDGGVTLLERCLTRVRELGDAQGEARALMVLGNAAQFRDGAEALPLLERSAALARKVSDSWCLAHALAIAGNECSCQDDLPAARLRLQESITIARGAQDRQSLRMGLLGLGLVATRQGDLAEAELLLDEGLAITDELGEDYGKATALEYLGLVATHRAEYDRAAQRFDAALELLRATGTEVQLIRVLTARALVAREEGDRRRARVLLEQALALGYANPHERGPALQGMGELAAADGDLVAARRLFEEALDLSRASGYRAACANALTGLGNVAQAHGDVKRAAVLYHEALELRSQIGSTVSIAVSLEAVAGVSAAGGRGEHAARLLGAAQSLRDAGGSARLPAEESRYRAHAAAVRELLEGRRFEAAFAQGAGLSVEQAVDLALRGNGTRHRLSSGWASLTETERHVAFVAAEGLTNAAIAARLLIAPATVKNHLSAIYRKLGIGRRAELAAEVWRRRQIDLRR